MSLTPPDELRSSTFDSLAGALLPRVRRIAVLRANALGDLIVSLPALWALRAAYPDAEIVLLGTRLHAALLGGQPGPVDRVEIVPPYGGVTLPEGGTQQGPELDAFFQRMQAERFDLALQMHGGGQNSNPFVTRLGAHLTVGLRACGAPPLDRTLAYVRYAHEVVRFNDLVCLVGAEACCLEPSLPVTDSDIAESLRALPEDGTRLVAIHPGANDPERVWPLERFAAVADALSERGARIVLVGNGGDRRYVAAVLAAMSHPATDLGDRLSLRGLLGLFRRCALMVGNDSGPRHLASAAGACTVGIFSIFNLVSYGPLHVQCHRCAVSMRMEGDPAVPPPAHGTYLSDVTVDSVRELALSLYQRRC
jgi:ADP-heptose:LPS heptosyltransferase